MGFSHSGESSLPTLITRQGVGALHVHGPSLPCAVDFLLLPSCPPERHRFTEQTPRFRKCLIMQLQAYLAQGPFVSTFVIEQKYNFGLLPLGTPEAANVNRKSQILNAQLRFLAATDTTFWLLHTQERNKTIPWNETIEAFIQLPVCNGACAGSSLAWRTSGLSDCCFCCKLDTVPCTLHCRNVQEIAIIALFLQAPF